MPRKETKCSSPDPPDPDRARSCFPANGAQPYGSEPARGRRSRSRSLVLLRIGLDHAQRDTIASEDLVKRGADGLVALTEEVRVDAGRPRRDVPHELL